MILLTHTRFLTKFLRQKRASSFERCFSRAFLLSEENATRHNKTEICWKEDTVDGKQEGEFISEIKVRINKTKNESTNVRTLAFARMHLRIHILGCVLQSSECRKIFRDRNIEQQREAEVYRYCANVDILARMV